MSNEDTKSEAERFSLPSQFVMEEDTEQYRLKTDKVYTYHRDGELVIQIDFSDFAINKDDIDRLGEEAVIKPNPAGCAGVGDEADWWAETRRC